MFQYAYLPFKSDLDSLSTADLLALKEVAEGWYVDYKSEPLKIKDCAKHLAAFANQYGGWLFIGIKEHGDGLRCAGSFPGVISTDVPNILKEIREAASAHVNPAVLYEEKVIEGPIPEIGLEAGKALIIIGIPQGTNPPYIHSSGRIYRRLADQSKPKEETDRHILDDLWKRGYEHNKKLSEFLTTVPDLPDPQKSSSWAYIYFMPSERQSPPKQHLTFDKFKEIVSNSNEDVLGVHVPMQAVHAASGGYVARAIYQNNPALATLTFRWWHDDGIVRLEIPLNSFGLIDFIKRRETYKHADEYLGIARKTGYQDMQIVDYSLLIQIVAALSNCYLHILKAIDDRRDIFSCFILKNVFHTSPFVDSGKFINRIEKCSLPLTLERDIVFPLNPTEDNMFSHGSYLRFTDDRHYSENQTLPPYIFSGPLSYMILSAVGILNDTEDYAGDEEIMGFDKVTNNNTSDKTSSE